MGKSAKWERDSLEMARRLACKEIRFAGLIYVGSPRKGRFYIPISKEVVEQRAIQVWGDETTALKLIRVISILRKVCRLSSVDEDLGKLFLKRRRVLDELMGSEE